LIMAVDVGEWSASLSSCALPLGIDPSPQILIVQEAGCASEMVWLQTLDAKILCLCWGSNHACSGCSQT
jgi:hypothetical protein